MKKNVFISAAGGLLFVFLFVFSTEFAIGISTGLSNCAKVVIPSLFPFMAAASLAGSGDIPEKAKQIINPLTEKIFGLPAESLIAVAIGQLGGYLAGAKAAETLCRHGRLNDSQARRLMLFSVNAGMGFSVNAVGTVLLRSRDSGRILLASLVISSLLIGFLAKFCSDTNTNKNKPTIVQSSFSDSVVTSVTSAAAATLNACAFVIAFSGITAVIEAHIQSESIRTMISCMLEVTNGCILSAGKIPLPVIAAICAFGGICVHLQIFSIARNIKINYFHFYLFRILHAASAYAVCGVILYFFPIEQSVFLSITENAALWSFSAPASISLLFLSALLILDLDNKQEIC